jgi:hypothetical protein
MGAGALATGAGAGAAVRLAPQFAQNDSPAALDAPQVGQVTVAPAVGIAPPPDIAPPGTPLAMAGAADASGSPHSSQKADPSGFSWPWEQRMDMILSSS